MAVYLKHTLAKLVASELAASDAADTEHRLSRAFLMADVCARCQLMETRAGATVAICLIQVRYEREMTMEMDRNDVFVDTIVVFDS